MSRYTLRGMTPHSPQPAELIIRLAVPRDTPTLGPFARRVFSQTFSGDPDHRPHDMAMFLAADLSDAALAAELVDPSIAYHLAESAGQLVGYLKLRSGHAPPCVAGRNTLEIARLKYLGVFDARAPRVHVCAWLV